VDGRSLCGAEADEIRHVLEVAPRILGAALDLIGHAQGCVTHGSFLPGSLSNVYNK